MYPAYVAGCYLRRRVIAYLAIAAVTIGVLVLIVVISVMDGFQNQIRKNIRGTSSHITIDNRDGRLNLVESVRDSGIEGIAGVSARLSQPVLIDQPGAGSSQRLEFGIIVGIQAKDEADTTDFRSYLLDLRYLKERYSDIDTRVLEHIDRVAVFKDGRRETPFPTHGPGRESRFPGIIVGKLMALSQGFRVGQEITLATVPRGELGPGQGGSNQRLRPKKSRFVIVGLYETQEYDFATKHIYMDMADTQDFLEAYSPNEVLVRLTDYGESDRVKLELQAYLDRDPETYCRVQTWEDRKRNLLDAIEVERRIMILLLFFVFIVAGFMILSILHSMVQEKIRDLGILRAMGATRSGVMAVFGAAGLMIGLIGAMLGTTLGVTLAWNLNTIDQFSKRHFNVQIFPEAVYGFEHIPVEVTMRWCLIVAGLGFACAVLSAFLPAWRAARLEPVEAIRHE